MLGEGNHIVNNTVKITPAAGCEPCWIRFKYQQNIDTGHSGRQCPKSTCQSGQVQRTSRLPATLIFKCLPARGKRAGINVERWLVQS